MRCENMDKIYKIMDTFGIPRDEITITRLQSEEDGEFYQVWRLDLPHGSWILKEAKGDEETIYTHYLAGTSLYTPQLFGVYMVDDKKYLLLEYIEGHDMRKCNRNDLTLVLDTLIDMQKEYWMGEDPFQTFEKSLQGRKNRRQFLLDSRLEAAYDAYLQEYMTMPRTLCHDDLLPFNVIISDDRAVLIDWETGGMLPYLTSFARLIAHGEEEENAFFYLQNADRDFAIDYFYQHFARKMGISQADYSRCLDFCLFYEYCEWVFVGNKYGNQDSERFRKYSQLATLQAQKLGF